MTMEREVLRTPEALKITGLHPDVWRDLTFRRLYRGAPRTSKGVANQFDLLDLVAAYCLGRMVDQLVMPSVAGKIATDILLKLRRDPTCEVPVLSAWRVKPTTKRIVVSASAPNAVSIELFQFRVAEIRARMLVGIAEKLRADPASLAGFSDRPAVSSKRTAE